MARPQEFSQSALYQLPLVSGTRRYSITSLRQHSNFAGKKVPRWTYTVSLVDYANEYLLLAVCFQGQQTQKVYVKVSSDQLLVTCTAGTDRSFLSLHAYLALEHLIGVRSYFDFEKYHWPGFFDPNTGKSKYLRIINDRKGLDVMLRKKYRQLIKPGAYLFCPEQAPAPKSRQAPEVRPALIHPGVQQIGFCIADTQLSSWHSNHFPFIRPYTVLLTADRRKTKSFGPFLSDQPEHLLLSASETELFQLAEQMLPVAPLANNSAEKAQQQIEHFDKKNFRQSAQLFELWQRAIGPLAQQSHTHYLYTLGLNNLKVRPKKQKMSSCSFSTMPIAICFRWTEKDDHYQLRYQFKAEGKYFLPARNCPLFFMRRHDAPDQLYLHSSLQDALLALFFAERGYEISMLKAHFQDFFAQFVNSLRRSYEFIVDR